jgi:hypothetical protein
MLTICTFNANNLFVRYQFGQTFPGAPPQRAKEGEITGTTASPTYGFLPKYQPGSFQIFQPTQRKLAAQALSRGEGKLPDVVFLQEIESLIALRTFNERHLKRFYTQAFLVDSRDFRQIDVGVLAGPGVEILEVRSHVDQLAPKVERYKDSWPWQFSRDCLEVHLALPNKKTFTAFLNHFKSKFVPPPMPEAGQFARSSPAAAVRTCGTDLRSQVVGSLTSRADGGRCQGNEFPGLRRCRIELDENCPNPRGDGY